MPSPTQALGGTYSIYVPDVDDLIDLGYTGIRVYWAASETATETLATTLTLVAGTKDYSYNKTDAAATDWAEHAFYGATPGEGPRSERVPIGPPQSTRLLIRQGVGRRLRMVDVVDVLSVVADTDFISSVLIDPDASPHKYANRFARVSSGAYADAIRRVRAYSTTAANSGYAPATGKIIVGRSFGGNLTAGDEVELWVPKRDEDPSTLIDEAMQVSRRHLWWEDTYYLATDSGVSDYFVPQGMIKAAIKSVEYAADSYPTRPGWLPVGDWDLVNDGGQPLLTVSSLATYNDAYAEGTVVRITYNRFGDRMDSDADYWNVPLEWAIAEVSLDFLKVLATPGGGKEDVSDAKVAKGELQEEVMEWRRAYMPTIRPRVRLPR